MTQQFSLTARQEYCSKARILAKVISIIKAAYANIRSMGQGGGGGGGGGKCPIHILINIHNIVMANHAEVIVRH